MWCIGNLHTSLVGVKNGIVTLEDSFRVLRSCIYFYHMTQQFHIEVFPGRNENLYPPKDSYKNVHSNLICNRQNLKTTQILTSRTMHKHVTLYTWYLRADTANLWGQNIICLWWVGNDGKEKHMATFSDDRHILYLDQHGKDHLPEMILTTCPTLYAVL